MALDAITYGTIGHMAAKGAVLPRGFPTGGSVGAEDLVGREATLRELYERVFVQRNSIVLSAPRQMGKTSVVDELLRRVRKAGGWAVSIDCSAATDTDDFAALVAAQTYDEASGDRDGFTRLADLIRNVPRPMLYHADSDLAVMFHTPNPTTPTSQKMARALSLADSLAMEKGKTAVVVYDEFPRLRTISPKLFDQVRATLQKANQRTSYVFMGSEVGLLNELFRRRGRMPFGLGTILQLGKPGDDEWIRYIERRFAQPGQPLAAGEAARLVAFAAGHPRDLMEVCQHLLTLRKLAGRRGADDVPLAEAQTLAGLARHFEDLWNSLDQPKGTKVTAVRIARGLPLYGRGRDPKAVKRSLDRLTNEGIVHKVGRGRFEFTEGLFGRYVAEISERS